VRSIRSGTELSLVCLIVMACAKVRNFYLKNYVNTATFISNNNNNNSNSNDDDDNNNNTQ
jgi:hypothetical protein